MSLDWNKVKQYVIEDVKPIFKRATSYSYNYNDLSEAFNIFYNIISSEHIGQQFSQKLTGILQTYIEYKKVKNTNLIDEIFNKLHEDSSLETYLKTICHLCEIKIPTGEHTASMACAINLGLVFPLHINKNTGKSQPNSKNIDEKNIEYHVNRAINIRNTKGHAFVKFNQAPDFISYTTNEKLLTIDNYLVTFLFAILKHKDKLGQFKTLQLDTKQVTSTITTELKQYLQNTIKDFDKQQINFVPPYLIEKAKNIKKNADKSEKQEPLIEGYVEEIISKASRFVIAAEPGMGKSTTLQYISKLYAEKIQNGENKLTIPVILNLNEFDKDTDINKKIFLKFKKYSIDEEQIKNWLNDRDITIFFDGLNEILDPDARKKVVNQIRDFLEEYPYMPVIITTRPYEYREQFDSLKTFEIKAFNEKQIKEFLAQKLSPEQQAKFDEHFIQHSGKLLELCKTPLILNFMAEYLQNNNGNIPESKGKLMREYFKEYIDKREKAKNEKIEYPLIVRILGKFAFKMRKEHKTVQLTYGNAEDLIREIIKGFDYEYKSLAFIKMMADMNILNHDEVIKFDHEMYQEYFAAEQLIEEYDKDKTILAKLKENKDEWEETLVLLYDLHKNKNLILEGDNFDSGISVKQQSTSTKFNPEQRQRDMAEVDRSKSLISLVPYIYKRHLGNMSKIDEIDKAVEIIKLVDLDKENFMRATLDILFDQDNTKVIKLIEKLCEINATNQAHSILIAFNNKACMSFSTENAIVEQFERIINLADLNQDSVQQLYQIAMQKNDPIIPIAALLTCNKSWFNNVISDEIDNLLISIYKQWLDVDSKSALLLWSFYLIKADNVLYLLDYHECNSHRIIRVLNAMIELCDKDTNVIEKSGIIAIVIELIKYYDLYDFIKDEFLPGIHQSYMLYALLKLIPIETNNINKDKIIEYIQISIDNIPLIDYAFGINKEPENPFDYNIAGYDILCDKFLLDVYQVIDVRLESGKVEDMAKAIFLMYQIDKNHNYDFSWDMTKYDLRTIFNKIYNSDDIPSRFIVSQIIILNKELQKQQYSIPYLDNYNELYADAYSGTYDMEGDCIIDEDTGVEIYVGNKEEYYKNKAINTLIEQYSNQSISSEVINNNQKLILDNIDIFIARIKQLLTYDDDYIYSYGWNITKNEYIVKLSEHKNRLIGLMNQCDLSSNIFMIDKIPDFLYELEENTYNPYNQFVAYIIDRNNLWDIYSIDELKILTEQQPSSN